MPSISLRREDEKSGQPRFRATAWDRQSVGRTVGEALDALVATWADDDTTSAVLIQRFRPDDHFTASQHDRQRDLLNRSATLTTDERAELEGLIDLELDATISRTNCLIRRLEP